MRPTNWLCLACEFRVTANGQSDMTSACEFHYWFPIFAFVFPPLTTRMRPTNWLWLAYEFWVAVTDNQTWIQEVSSNFQKYSFLSLLCFAFVVQLFFVGTQLREIYNSLIDWVWHVYFGWFNEQSDMITDCKLQYLPKMPPLITHSMPFMRTSSVSVFNYA